MERLVPVPRLPFEHAAPHGTDDERHVRPIARREVGIGERFAGRGQGQAIGARAPSRDAEAADDVGGYLRGDA